MTCTSCGDKPKNSSKRFPRAVVEINNPESLVLLRKVVIPVSMGTEEDVPPTIGKYFNVILQYESNGHIYLYSSDGIPTAIEANIPQEVLDRIDQLEIDVDLLETGLANETTAREAADTALGGRIDTVADNLATETANRISADEGLQADITAEATARQNADATLQNNITAEATARENGDAALNTAITSETTARQEADTNLQNQITQEAQARAAADTAINGAITAEASTRQTADAGLQSQIDAITASSDVKDIVGTKAELSNYDTSTLGDNDIIKVLQDESENNATTYYRWNATTQQFSLIGEEGPYYTKSQADTLLNAKQNTLTAGSNVQIVNDTISATDTTYTAGTGLALNGTQFSVDTTAIATQSDLTAGLATKQDTLTAGTNVQINNNVVSATDTTYSDFTGTDGTTAGTAGLVPAPATTDAGKFLKADGTWDTAGGGGGDTVYSSKTTSNSATGGAVYIGNLGTDQTEVADPTTTDNHYKYFWALPASNNGASYGLPGNGSVNIMGSAKGAESVAIGNQAGMSSYGATYSVMIGSDANAGPSGVSIGYSSGTSQDYVGNVCIGANSKITSAGITNSVALGRYSTANRSGEVNVGTGNNNYGFNSTKYRVIGGVHDAVDGHDATTLNQLDGRVKQNAGAPTTATVGTVGQLLEDTTNGKLYICTDTTGGTYTWTEVGAGGGGGLDPNTTFWGQTASNGVVDGGITISSADGRPGMYIGYGQIEIDKPAAFYLRAKKDSSTYSNVLWWNSASNNVPSDVHLDAAGTKMTLLTNEVRLGGRYSSDNVKISNVATPQSAQDAATKGYVDPSTGTSAPTTSTTGRLGEVRIDTSTNTAYMCVSADSTTSTFIWKQITA